MGSTSPWNFNNLITLVDAVSPVLPESIYLYSELFAQVFLSSPPLHGTNKKPNINLAMPFDLTVLVLTAIAMLRSPRHSSLRQLLFRQGVVYFLVAFVANMVPTIFNRMYFLLPSNLLTNMSITSNHHS